jgi:hypothetical protein
MKIKGFCVSNECINGNGDNHCILNGIVIYRGECCNYKKRKGDKENNK